MAISGVYPIVQASRASSVVPVFTAAVLTCPSVPYDSQDVPANTRFLVWLSAKIFEIKYAPCSLIACFESLVAENIGLLYLSLIDSILVRSYWVPPLANAA